MNEERKRGLYDDIIDLPHHVSATHPPMSMIDRAAQFAPFAALTGYEAAVEETARLTSEKVSLDEDALAVLNRRLVLLAEREGEGPEVCVTYFRPDDRKQGGAYVTVTGRLKHVDEYEQKLILTDGSKIPVDDIAALEGRIFRDAERPW